MNTYKLENPISVSYLQDNLRDELPRLVLTRELEANLRNRLDTDPVVQNVYKAIKLNAEQVFEESIINLDIPMEERSQDNQLDISRDLLLRINVLAMVYRIENDRRMLGRIDEEVIAACNFPSWNPQHVLDVGEMCRLVLVLVLARAGIIFQQSSFKSHSQTVLQ